MEPKFFRKVLSNGMTILLEKRDLPVVSVCFAVRAGGIHEKIEEKGISHYIEHMLYKGTSSRSSQDITNEIEKNGGELNGFTSEEVVGYYCKMPSKHLNVALEVLGDMVKNPLFDEKELEKERQVIFEELKMYKDDPRRHVFDGIYRLLYSKTMGISLIGTYESMNAIDRKKILSKFKEIYTPNNLILCVVGDCDFNELLKFVEKNFSNEKSEIKIQDFDLISLTEIEKRKGIDQANLVFAYHSPLSKDKLSYASKVLMTLMAGGMSSRLWREIREKRNLAYVVKGDSNIGKNFSYNFVWVGTAPENVEKVKEVILNEFQKVQKDLDLKELNEVKEQIIGNYQIAMEDSKNQMINLLSSEIEGNAEEFYNFEKNIREVKLEDVKKLAKINKYSFFALVPEE